MQTIKSFVQICGLAICCNCRTDHFYLLHIMKLFFLGRRSFFKTFMPTLKSLYTSLRLQTFLPKCCTYAVSVDIAHLLNKPFLFAMQTFKSLYASLKLQVFFFCLFVLICGRAICCIYVNIDIAQLLNRPFLFAQTFTL